MADRISGSIGIGRGRRSTRIRQSAELQSAIDLKRRKSNIAPDSLMFKTKQGGTLSPQELDSCYKLVRNMRWIYINAQDGWSQTRKLDEMRNNELTYILCYSSGSRKGREYLAGFASFAKNDTLPGLDYKVTYLWEIHVHPKFQRCGIGKALLERVAEVAGAVNEPIALRCFTNNTRASAFYIQLGFKILPIECDAASEYLELSTPIALTQTPPQNKQDKQNNND